MVNIYAYAWSMIVERDEGEAVTKVAKELREWPESPTDEEGNACSMLGSQIQVFFSEDADKKYGDIIRVDKKGRVHKRPTATLRKILPGLVPPEGKAMIYISDLFAEYTELTLQRIADVFNKHGVMKIWLIARKESPYRSCDNAD